MTLLGGLFSRKNKARQRDIPSSTSTASTTVNDDASLSSPTPSYVTPDRNVPSVPNGKSHLHPDAARDIHTNLHGYHSSLQTMPSTSKLRLPFTRKKSSIKPPEPTYDTEEDLYGTSPKPSYLGRTTTNGASSDAESTDYRRLRPPPSKSAIFAAYTDPHSALSTRSLPQDGYHIHSEAPLPAIPPPQKQQPTKRPSLFAWTKSASPKTIAVPSKEAKLLAPSSPPRSGVTDSSFNLKSFRHVGSPTHVPTQASASNVSLHAPAPIARQRSDTVNSDASTSQQRISVAAFREAQARRSLAGSPSPSVGRSPSPLPSSPPIPPEVHRGTPNTRSPPMASPTFTPSPAAAPRPNHRKSFASTSLFASDTDESDSSMEAETDDEGTFTPAKRGRQAAARPGLKSSRAKSEMGHGSPLDRRGPTPRFNAKSHHGHDNPSPQPRPHSEALLSNFTAEEGHPPRSQSTLGVYGANLRPRASASTSALTPSAAAKRASIVVKANAGMDAAAELAQYKQTSRHVRDSSIHSNPGEPPSIAIKKAATNLGHGNFPLQQPMSSDSDSDSDNAPLATLLAPRRPGSAMSSYSNGNNSTRSMPPKPLIDIKELTGGSSTTNKSALAPTFNRAEKSMEGFTQGRTLLARATDKPGKPDKAGSISSSSSQNVVSKVPPFKFVSPPSTPRQEAKKQLGMTTRSATMPLPATSASTTSVTPVTGNEKEPYSEGEKKRDALSERLSKVVKTTVGSTDFAAGRSPSPLPTPQLPTSRSSTPILREAKSLSPESPSRRMFLEPVRSESPLTMDGPPPRSVAPPVAQKKRSTRPDEIFASSSSATIRGSSAVSKPSPPDPSLADLLGAAGMKLISRTGESSSESESGSEESEEESEESDGYGYDSRSGQKGPLGKSPKKGKEGMSSLAEKKTVEEKIVPIPIKQRQPAPSFSVTSRPQAPRSPVKQNTLPSTLSSATSGSSSGGSALGSSTKSPALSEASSYFSTRKRSSTLTPLTTPSSYLVPTPPFASSSASARGTPPPPEHPSPSPAPVQNQATIDRTSALRAVGATVALQPQPRQRSSTLVPMMPAVNTGSQQQQSNLPAMTHNMPNRPFATRRDSPASSTGDSSNGLAPLTPRDGSEIGLKEKAMIKGQQQSYQQQQQQQQQRQGQQPQQQKQRQTQTQTHKSSASSQDLAGLQQYSGGASGLATTAHARQQKLKRASVSFEDDVVKDDGRTNNRNSRADLISRGGNNSPADRRRSVEVEMEERRKERRREEAKAAIEVILPAYLR
ncbi:hypothetical protein FA15DRAFT_669698 [Coprinopsis marcescibilis]|uniref:Uncharacterized protein n=1 Tax=Coprinopsis marcescibilis TaxID=230819 RepID=A0A5C3L7N7_COPMA|nr:hypothetical protein FA15DRAFT_669698 [Coprinopsis marcescibilis]